MDRDLTKRQWEWEMLRQGMLVLQKAITESLTPAFQRLAGAICTFVIQLQRFQLQSNLARHWWISERFAHWLSDKWPERWLPELRFE